MEVERAGAYHRTTGSVIGGQGPRGCSVPGAARVRSSSAEGNRTTEPDRRGGTASLEKPADSSRSLWPLSHDGLLERQTDPHAWTGDSGPGRRPGPSPSHVQGPSLRHDRERSGPGSAQNVAATPQECPTAQ